MIVIYGVCYHARHNFLLVGFQMSNNIGSPCHHGHRKLLRSSPAPPCLHLPEVRAVRRLLSAMVAPRNAQR